MRKLRRGIWLLWFALLCFLLAPVYSQAEETSVPELYARAACLMDGDSGRVLYEKEGNSALPMASTTKIMTCILALEDGQMEDWVTVSSYAASQPKVHMGASEGEQFLLQDLLFALMLNSDNDAAVMIAEHLSGSVEAFAEKMNLKARELGCLDTYFITPNGLDAEDDYGVHHTTAEDLARILKYCIMESPQKERFLEITRMPAYTFWNQSHTKVYQCTNHNAFLDMMDGALTGKTGFTADAGYCYVGALTSEGRTFIVALLACGWPNNKGYKWADTRTLMQYGIDHYFYRDVFERGLLEELEVEDGQYEGLRPGEKACVGLGYGTPEEELSYPMLLREDEEVHTVLRLPDRLTAPVEEGQQVGQVQYYLGDELLKEYPVFTLQDVYIRDYAWCLGQIGEEYRM